MAAHAPQARRATEVQVGPPWWRGAPGRFKPSLVHWNTDVFQCIHFCGCICLEYTYSFFDSLNSHTRVISLGLYRSPTRYLVSSSGPMRFRCASNTVGKEPSLVQRNARFAGPHAPGTLHGRYVSTVSETKLDTTVSNCICRVLGSSHQLKPSDAAAETRSASRPSRRHPPHPPESSL